VIETTYLVYEALLYSNRASVKKKKKCVCMRELIPYAPEPFPSRGPFSHGIPKLRIQTEDSQGQPGALVAPSLYFNNIIQVTIIEERRDKIITGERS